MQILGIPSLWFYSFHLVVQPCLPDHQYSSNTVNDNQCGPETVDRGMQTDIGMEEMAEFMELKKRFENPNAIMRDLFIEKVTASDKSVKQYTGVPSKSMLNGLYGKMFSLYVWYANYTCTLW